MSDFTADDILNKGQRPAGKGNTTRPSGQPVPSENTSVTAGQQGPVALNDIHLIEKLAHFNRERVPERTPHAKGHGAFGELHITEDVSAYTKAKVFQKGTVTPMMGRFSTVAGERGAAEERGQPAGEIAADEIEVVNTSAAAAPGGLFSRLRNAFAGK